MNFLSSVATLGLVSLALTACSPSDEPATSTAQDGSGSERAATSSTDANDAPAQMPTDLPPGCENLQAIYRMLPQDKRIGDFDRDSEWCGGFHAVSEYFNKNDGYEFHVQVLDGESQLLADEMNAVGDGSEVIARQMKDIITKNGEAFLEAQDLCEEMSEARASAAHRTGSGICVMKEGEKIWLARQVHNDDIGLLIRFYAISPDSADDAWGAAQQLEPLFEEFTVTE